MTIGSMGMPKPSYVAVLDPHNVLVPTKCVLTGTRCQTFSIGVRKNETWARDSSPVKTTGYSPDDHQVELPYELSSWKGGSRSRGCRYNTSDPANRVKITRRV
jgi:hypothetical protein